MKPERAQIMRKKGVGSRRQRLGERRAWAIYFYRKMESMQASPSGLLPPVVS